VLVDDAGADIGDFGSLGEPVDDEAVQALVVGHRDVQEKVFEATKVSNDRLMP
jgi:hypothetical protein